MSQVSGTNTSPPKIFLDVNRDGIDDKTQKPIPLGSLVSDGKEGTTWVQSAQTATALNDGQNNNGQ